MGRPTEKIEAARSALLAGEWDQARHGFGSAADSGAGAVAAEGLNWVAWYLDQGDEAIAAFERTYHAADRIRGGRPH